MTNEYYMETTIRTGYMSTSEFTMSSSALWASEDRRDKVSSLVDKNKIMLNWPLQFILILMTGVQDL